eukprot:GHVS01089951.1.p1 GENE.GHVS01089951.1~~GHVS01089951.1.p1  ORF type:complete len:215 (+),score=25.94 GHVS01089951.1:551-1195(+)
MWTVSQTALRDEAAVGLVGPKLFSFVFCFASSSGAVQPRLWGPSISLPPAFHPLGNTLASEEPRVSTSTNGPLVDFSLLPSWGTPCAKASWADTPAIGCRETRGVAADSRAGKLVSYRELLPLLPDCPKTVGLPELASFAEPTLRGAGGIGSSASAVAILPGFHSASIIVTAVASFLLVIMFCRPVCPAVRGSCRLAFFLIAISHSRERLNLRM